MPRRFDGGILSTKTPLTTAAGRNMSASRSSNIGKPIYRRRRTAQPLVNLRRGGPAARAVIEKPMKLIPIIMWAVWAAIVALILGLAILSPAALLAVAA